MRVWDIAKAAVVKELAADNDTVWSVAFSPDGRRLATASSEEIVTVWDVGTGQQRAVLTGHNGGATDVAYLADGLTLVAVDRSGKVHLWDAQNHRRLAEATQGHERASWQIALHPDGRRFATAGDDGQVKSGTSSTLRASATSRESHSTTRAGANISAKTSARLRVKQRAELATRFAACLLGRRL